MMQRNDTSFCGALGSALLSTLVLISPALLPGCSGDSESDHAGGHDEHDEHGDDHDDHDEGGEDGHGDHSEDSVGLTQAQIEAAGIRVATAARGVAAQVLTLPAVVAANADTMSHVNPQAPGIVRSIHKHLGDSVTKGELLCVIDSIELGKAVAEFLRAEALVGAAETTLEREGKLFEGRINTAERMLSGAVDVNRRIFERETELRDKAVSTIRPLLEADKALKNSELEKDRQLTDLRAERDTRLLALEVSLTERRIDREATRSTLLALGVKPGLLDQLQPDSPLLAGTYEIRAPRGGIVSGRHITAGEFVDAETKLYTLEDLSRVWILASAFEKQVLSLRTGQAGRIHLDAFPGIAFEGQVTLIGYEVDPESRALGVRLELENTTLAEWSEPFPLRPGMFGSVDLVVGRTEARVVLPESAIVHENDGDFVFVQVAAGEFERRHVELGPPTGNVVEVRAGVAPGEKVAVAGTFHLKSALRRGELGGGHSH